MAKNKVETKNQKKRPYKMTIKIDEVNLIKILNDSGHSIDKEYSVEEVFYDSINEDVEIILVDCSQINV